MKQGCNDTCLQGPLSNLRVIHQEFSHLHVLGDWDVELDAATIEIPGHQQLTEFLVEGAKV